MNFFARGIVSVIVGWIKDLWYSYMTSGIKEELKKEQQELENAKKGLDDQYSDFIDDYNKYKSSKRD